MSSTSSACDNRRKFDKIPVFIVENHNDVLEVLLPSLARRYLPFENNLMIHFDSHPDLCVPRTMPAAAVFNRQELLESLSIENWIIPLMFAGNLKEVVWIAPAWSRQLSRGCHNFTVGECAGKIKVSASNLDYFLSDGCCEDKSLMDNTKNVTIRVLELENETTAADSMMSEILRDDWILDIDLDYFSTFNPFLNIYPKAETYKKLKKIFQTSKDANETVLEYQKRRNHELDYFESIFQFMAQNGSLEKFKNEDPNMNDKFELVKDLIASLCHHYSIYEIDWFVINDAGCTCDDDEFEIPNHESDDETIREMMNKFEKFLKHAKIPPALCTIARSCDDGYTPRHQVEMIQCEVLKVLKRIYGDNLGDEVLWYKSPSADGISALELVQPKKKSTQNSKKT